MNRMHGLISKRPLSVLCPMLVSFVYKLCITLSLGVKICFLRTRKESSDRLPLSSAFAYRAARLAVDESCVTTQAELPSAVAKPALKPSSRV
jgi:hypothetical protein